MLRRMRWNDFKRWQRITVFVVVLVAVSAAGVYLHKRPSPPEIGRYMLVWGSSPWPGPVVFDTATAEMWRFCRRGDSFEESNWCAEFSPQDSIAMARSYREYKERQRSQQEYGDLARELVR